MPDFLLEIGLEEIPARMIPAAEAELLRRTLALFGKEALLSPSFNPLTDAHSYSTPRRLAVLISNVETQQSDITEETTGPAVKIAFKDGVPTPAAEAFARKSGVAVADLRTISTPKGEYLAATSIKKGRSASEVIASELPKEIAALYWAKNMRWISGSGAAATDSVKFVRPVLWLACLLGDTVVPVSFAGKTAGRATYGHRVLSSGEPFEITSPATYLSELQAEYVLADVEARRHKIRKALDHVTRTVPSARWREDEALVDAVTHLTEWPDVLLGDFEPNFLTLPEEVLVTVMRDHQKYFAVEDAKGTLAPHFLTVTNIALDAENAAIIRQGNERVLRARFNDAQFFWNFDQKTPLVDRIKLLANVTFQKQLGSYEEKSARVLDICHLLSELSTNRGVTLDRNALSDSASLAKADLTTELVKEFTELQGIIGGMYFKDEASRNPRLAEQKQRVEITWQAIYDQYLPASSEDRIPRNAEGCILGLADRIDTITGMFSLRMEPTGSKDPLALRRAANAIIRILAEARIQLLLTDVIRASKPTPEIETKLKSFFEERLKFYLRELKGFKYDTIAAVLKASSANPNWRLGDLGFDDISDVVKRANAIDATRSSENFLQVCAAYKRLKNIFIQAHEQGDVIVSFEPVFDSPVEAEIWERIKNAGAGYLADCLKQDYEAALAKLADLRPAIDRYFENVMVMADDIQIRAERLGLVRYLVVTFAQIADFSEIVTAG